MRIYTSIDSFRDVVTEYKNGEVRHNEYGVEDVLKFIENEGKNLMNLSENGRKTKAFELFETIYPRIKFNEEVLGKLFNLGGKAFFDEFVGNTALMNDDKTKFKIYNLAIKSASSRIDNLEEKICEEQINKSDSCVIEELEDQLTQEETWKSALKEQRKAMIQKTTEKPEYDSNGFDTKTRNTYRNWY